MFVLWTWSNRPWFFRQLVDDGWSSYDNGLWFGNSESWFRMNIHTVSLSRTLYPIVDFRAFFLFLWKEIHMSNNHWNNFRQTAKKWCKMQINKYGIQINFICTLTQPETSINCCYIEIEKQFTIRNNNNNNRSHLIPKFEMIIH